MADWWKVSLIAASNVLLSISIVFANKAVFAIYHWNFTYALTLLHTITTVAGMYSFAALNFYQPKQLPKLKLLPLALAFVGYVVTQNISLRLNTVGFYQISKISITPGVLVLEAFLFKKYPTTKELLSVLVVCLGVALATVTDTQMGSNMIGVIVGFGAVVVTAVYQVLAGSKQKELQASSMQLLHQYSPMAAICLGILVPSFEPLGITNPTPTTILGYDYNVYNVAAIAISSVLGLLMSLTTFILIGATSSITYNVVGHLKTVFILAGGCFFFGDEMPAKKFCGICLAMTGIFWYSHLKLSTGTLVAAKTTDEKAPNKPRTLAA
ncbi:hypothetical protein WJX84_007288 [Apatococcus fuscideae]|uniref:Sugar phosphate transporter domain-containing protein n=1 Tax=Apatococcus fuscideae TaxID=2026836 RepID=A0AAW1T0S5_9CHLO